MLAQVLIGRAGCKRVQHGQALPLSVSAHGGEVLLGLGLVVDLLDRRVAIGGDGGVHVHVLELVVAQGADAGDEDEGEGEVEVAEEEHDGSRSEWKVCCTAVARALCLVGSNPDAEIYE